MLSSSNLTTEYKICREMQRNAIMGSFSCVGRWLYCRKNAALLAVLFMAFINIYSYHHGCRSILSFNPLSVSNFRHGHVNVLPAYMYANENLHESDETHLVPSSMSNTVHYFWFDQKQFQFENYLSVISAYKFLKPGSIIFHYCYLPELDSLGYYQFYAELIKNVPIVKEEALQKCVSGDDRLELILSMLNQRGGIYVGEKTILSNSLISFRAKSLSYFVTGDSEGVIMLKRETVPASILSGDVRHALLSSTPSELTCVDALTYSISNPNHHCVTLQQEVFPKDIFTGDSGVKQLLRWIYFGSKESHKPKTYETKSPLIVHYVWLGDRSLTFFDYLSVLSVVYVLKAEHVYIHGDIKPKGRYWQKTELIPQVRFIFRRFPQAVFGNRIVAFASHGSDFLRGDLLIRYGGIYMDWDVIWVNSIPDKLRHFGLVVGVDPVTTGAFPDVFNMGVLIGQKGSKFMQYFLESYRHYLDKHWSYNAIHMPYKIYEQHSDLVHVEPHLVVICSNNECHPSWLPDFKEKSHLDGLNFDWRNETLCLHVTYPDPEEYNDIDTLLKSNSMFGDIGKYVLSKVTNKELLDL